ncbi:Uncharacterised protein [Dorea longicatena]|nr:Uncharacterised protein [Dorea longicatena]
MTKKDSKKHRKNSVQNPKEHSVHTTTVVKMPVYMMSWMQNYLLSSSDMIS